MKYNLFFVNPRQLPINAVAETDGKICVYDLGFSNQEGGYEKVTLPFLQKFESRIHMWVDHHDHERWIDWQAKPNFRFVPRVQAPSCPFLITRPGEFREIPVHVLDKDFDALITLIRAVGGGYDEMLWDSVWAECRHETTFKGVTVKGFSQTGRMIESALKAHWNPEEGGNQVRLAVFNWLVYGNPRARSEVERAGKDYEPVLRETERHLKNMRIVDQVIAVCDLRGEQKFEKFDLTGLMLLMRESSRFAVVVQRNRKGEFITISTHNENLDLTKLFGVPGGFARRVTVEHLSLDSVIARLQSVL